jgi:hypothetical protein
VVQEVETEQGRGRAVVGVLVLLAAVGGSTLIWLRRRRRHEME